MPIKIVKAGPNEAHHIDAIVSDLVDYHKLTGQSILNEELLQSNIGSFSDPSKYFESFLAIEESHDRACSVVGHLMYQKYFSFLSGKTIWMENLFVQEAKRGTKIGQKLLKELAKVAQQEGAPIQWLCIDWNVNSIGFYEHMGAVAQFKRSDGWICYQFDHDVVNKLATKEFQ